MQPLKLVVPESRSKQGEIFKSTMLLVTLIDVGMTILYYTVIK